MAKILSQDEIDALLSTVTSSEPEQTDEPARSEHVRSVITYDFKHPNRVSKDQLRTLENMHDNFAGHIGSTLSTMLRTMVDVDLISVDQINYSEYIMSLVSPSSTYTFSAAPLEGLCVIDYSPTLVFAFIDRMFGGGEKVLEIERELTNIERSIMGKIAGRIFGDLENSWKNMVPVTIEQKSFETNPQFVQVVPASETVIVVSLQLKLFNITGLLTICYPYVSLESVLGKLSAQNWIDATKRKSQEENRANNQENLQKVTVEVALNLARTTLKMKDFLNLKIGDVISTETKIDAPVEMLVGGRKKYMCRPGLFGKRRAGQITEIYPIIEKE
ncbi:MAG: flagellar motor switch protein FliM [candidate division Zixibacteria bacterium]|nr:flagellar motor switch protein FliM [candidate division Zixibacteria bacterium]